MVGIVIDGRKLQARAGQSVLQVATENGIEIPTLCHHGALPDTGACRVCLIEIIGTGGWSAVKSSCTLPVSEGLEIRTETKAVKKSRRIVLELLLGRAPRSEVILALAARDGLTETRYVPTHPVNDCVLCGLCVRVCTERLGVEAITYTSRTCTREISAAFGKVSDSCLACGSCVELCPTGAMRLTDTETIRSIWFNDRKIGERELLRCHVCGEAISSREFFDWTAARLEQTEHMNGTRENLCPDCARREFATRMSVPIGGR
jgi:bidirectional [NiFe] hydrogenase diaphorase subunit